MAREIPVQRDASRIDLADLTLARARVVVIEAQVCRGFRARQIFQWIWKRGATDFDGDERPAPRSARAAGRATSASPRRPSCATSSSEDGTQKLVLALADARQIECVYIPDTPAQTFCVSTQVGCAMGCAFCLTGKMGLVRNLTAGEIAGQVRVLAAATGLLDAAVQHRADGHGRAAAQLRRHDEGAARCSTTPHGLALPPRRVTLSTVGLVPMLDKLATEPLMPNLAISLHATTEEQRAAIVPPSKKYGLQRHHRGLPSAFPLSEAQPHHLRVRAARRRQRHAGRRAPARQAARRRQGQGQSHSAERRRRASPSIARRMPRVDAFARILADKAIDRVGAPQPRARHPGRLRPAHRRRRPARRARRKPWPPRCSDASPASSCMGCRRSRLRGRGCDRCAAASRRRSAICSKQLDGLRDPAAREPRRSSAFVASAGRRIPIVEQNARLVFFVQGRRTGRTPRIVGDFNAWATTPQGYDATVGHADADRRHAVVVSRGHRRSPTRASNMCFLFEKETTPDPRNPRTVRTFVGPRSEIRMPFWTGQPEVDGTGPGAGGHGSTRRRSRAAP